MLYYCPCNSFCPQKNDYRKLYANYMILYGLMIIQNITKGLCILIFEGGGLHDEYNIVKRIIKGNTNKIAIDIMIIDMVENDQMFRAQRHFQSLLVEQINAIEFFLSLSLRQINLDKYDSIIALSLDPYYFLIDHTFKSMINDVSSFPSSYSFINLSMLYLKNNTITWDMILYNKRIYNNNIISTHMIGIENNFHTKKQKNFCRNFKKENHNNKQENIST